MNRTVLYYFLVMVAITAVCRVIPRPDGLAGFAPQLAIAIFAGAIIKDKKFSFLLPFFSMLLSDCFYEILFRNGLAPYGGFYSGQWQNYLLICSMTVIGFFIKRINVKTVLTSALAAPLIYFILSNFVVWAGHGGYQRPMTFAGLIQCYGDGLPFLVGSIVSSLFFSALFFGTYVLLVKKRQPAIA
ncbi:MAG TPA: DUF6580 family putative transport protein [Chitinophagaceae bacterium]|nr:DUF6580 family putative transport protein [Chitinophagaceae bacterium]